MIRDPRGGHNRYKVNENFFKTWSLEMAYVLGYICADGSIVDARKSSRTQYIQIDSNEASILRKIKKAINCNHPIHKFPLRNIRFPKGKTYTVSGIYRLRIGNKIMFHDLISLGITPRKSLSLSFPDIPYQYLNHFIRGYFDGDGCLSFYKPKNRKVTIVRLYFISGSKIFLDQLSNIFSKNLDCSKRNIYRGNGEFRIFYGKYAALKILNFLYKNTGKNKLYLERKYRRYLMLLQEIDCQRNLRKANNI